MRPVVALCVLVVAVGGCGGASAGDSAKDFKGQEQDVAKTIEDLEKAAVDDDAAKVCKQLLSDSLLAALRKQGTNCTRAVKEAFDDADSVELEVDDVTIAGGGQTATARVVSGRPGADKKTDVIKLERDGSAWKISALGS